MTNDEQIAAQVAEAVKERPLDVTGQPGGPSPEEQALVDDEQRVIMAQQAEARRPQELEEARARQDRMQSAMERQAEMKSVLTLLRNLDDRLRVLEDKK